MMLSGDDEGRGRKVIQLVKGVKGVLLILYVLLQSMIPDPLDQMLSATGIRLCGQSEG
jgi:hypothetical protein